MSATATTETKVVVPAPAVITLAGKVAIVTGASRGIGQGIALRLARDGAKVVVNYQKDAKSAESVVAAIKSVGGSAVAIQGDVSKSSQVNHLFDEAKRIYGGIDIVVANAATHSGGTIGATTDEEFDRLFEGNVKSVFYTLRASSNHIRDNGRVIIIGSVAKVGTTAGFGPYAASKLAIEALSNTLAQELGGKGVTVNTVHPGPTVTDGYVFVPEPVRNHFNSLTPFGRAGTVADISDAVALIASESARWISGQAIAVSGALKA